MFYLFAGLCLIPNVALTLINKVTTNKHNEYVVCFLKGFFYIFFAFAFVAIRGHIPNIFDGFKNARTGTFLIINALCMGVVWALYFFSLKRAPLTLFNSTNLTSAVFATSIISIIFTGSIVTNGWKPLNTGLYITAMAMTFVILLLAIFSKESKENGSRMWIWVLLFFTALSEVNNLIFMNQELAPAGITEDIIIFYQAIGITIVNLLIILFMKKTKEIKSFTVKEHVLLAISSLCELLYYFLYDLAINYEGSNHAIVIIIAKAGFFFLIQLSDIIFFKKKPSLFFGIMLIIFASALVLECLAGSI